MDKAEDLVEVIDKSFSIIADNKDTTRETVPTLSQPVSIVDIIIISLKNVLSYNLSGRKRDHRWEIIMYN